MRSLEKIILIFAMSFSSIVVAADSSNTTEQRDKSLERRHSGETMQMRGCLDRNGNDQELCNKEILDGATNSNQKSRAIQNRNNTTRDKLKSKDLSIEGPGTQPSDKQSESRNPSESVPSPKAN